MSFRKLQTWISIETIRTTGRLKIMLNLKRKFNSQLKWQPMTKMLKVMNSEKKRKLISDVIKHTNKPQLHSLDHTNLKNGNCNRKLSETNHSSRLLNNLEELQCLVNRIIDSPVKWVVVSKRAKWKVPKKPLNKK